MLFRCTNCFGNVVYSPETGKMFCPYCSGADTQETLAVPNTVNCVNCSGEIQVNDFTSATKCAYCGSYMIFDERVNGTFTPHLIMPFKLGKERVKEIMRKEFGKKLFAPDDFLSEVKLSTMEGMYVPFWMYDFDTHYNFQGRGTKVRSWRRGNTQYTETTYYNVLRDMDASFEKIPVDASYAMEDSTMDLLEPYNYTALEQFQEKYMSGFFSERYNYTAEQLEPRASAKAQNDTEELMQKTLGGYATMVPVSKNMNVTRKATQYALLPVWTYIYKYNNQLYPFQINGQTGKVVGNVPISKKKAAAYTATTAVVWLAIGLLIKGILGGF